MSLVSLTSFIHSCGAPDAAATQLAVRVDRLIYDSWDILGGKEGTARIEQWNQYSPESIERARRKVAEALTLAPASVNALAADCVVNSVSQAFDRAAVSCRRALELSPQIGAYERLAQVYDLAREPEQSREIVIQARKNGFDSEVLRRFAINADRRQNRLTHALAEADEWLSAHKESAIIHERRGAVLLSLDRPADALESFYSAIKADPKSDADAGVCGALVNLDRDEASDWCQRALARNPMSSGARDNYGVLLARRHEAEAALAEFQKAASFDPSDDVPIWHIGQTYELACRLDEAKEQYEKASNMAPHKEQYRRAVERVRALGAKPMTFMKACLVGKWPESGSGRF